MSYDMMCSISIHTNKPQHQQHKLSTLSTAAALVAVVEK
jgi:hypothetical protein